MFDKIQSPQYVALRLPSGTVKVEQITPNTLISLGKYGSFHSNQIIGRPYYLTFEILDRAEQKDGRDLRVVKASEIHAETILEEAEPDLGEDDSVSTPNAGQFDEYGLPLTTDKSNVNIIDDPNNQKLTYDEIEALKSDKMSNPKELITKIMANHAQLDQKTAFSLAKYTLRKQKKYMKRFTVIPLDVCALTTFLMEEKDFTRILEIRNETLGLMGSWANVHASGPALEQEESRCRYLMVDDTGGLLVAAVAERMGILHHQQPTQSEPSPTHPHKPKVEGVPTEMQDEAQIEAPSIQRPRRQRYDHTLATSNTITLVHANQQPNLSLLRYFAFDHTQPPSSVEPNPHQLHTHLQTLTWLQLLQPEADSTYSSEPPVRTSEELSALKPNHRSNYYRKRRRWARTKQVVDTARAGGFDGLIVATYMDPISVLKHLVPLLRGGAQVVVYSPTIEPLMEVCDVYSTARRTAYLQAMRRRQALSLDGTADETKETSQKEDNTGRMEVGDEDDKARADETRDTASGQELPVLDDARFPADPTLLLTPALHHSYARQWQVLPGRTHPLMTAKGGAEGGYVLVSTRVIPLQGVIVQARGKPGRAKKRTGAGLDQATSAGTPIDNGNNDNLGGQASKRTKVENDTAA
ncbi:tRNA (adenine(58)-N(1))-methyltransferase non-catalytic subunit trm6 [Lithohypha guttulata]|uniref:tRNA (adenine(58)-N(1))-methyltransferase non-catalytic subunit TRM6 n=1 Tax=Lithohypha guttulata TaxID=1690604 RepID=A0AAN7YCN1_9EURO|nr:tRNA (adenine(58)-N(1))-methyltransferase non-catalytic subunit trm6 [Lithohypha guttulata]